MAAIADTRSHGAQVIGLASERRQRGVRRLIADLGDDLTVDGLSNLTRFGGGLCSRRNVVVTRCGSSCRSGCCGRAPTCATERRASRRPARGTSSTLPQPGPAASCGSSTAVPVPCHASSSGRWPAHGMTRRHGLPVPMPRCTFCCIDSEYTLWQFKQSSSSLTSSAPSTVGTASRSTPYDASRKMAGCCGLCGHSRPSSVSDRSGLRGRNPQEATVMQAKPSRT